jgi:hypothetical protein
MSGALKILTAGKRKFTQGMYIASAGVTGLAHRIGDGIAYAGQKLGEFQENLSSGIAGAAGRPAPPKIEGAEAAALGLDQFQGAALSRHQKQYLQSLEGASASAENFGKNMAGAFAEPSDAMKGFNIEAAALEGAFEGMSTLGEGTVEERLKALPAAVEEFSKSLAGKDEGLLRFSSGLLQTATSAAALKTSLESVGGTNIFGAYNEELNTFSSALDIMKPKGELASFLGDLDLKKAEFRRTQMAHEDATSPIKSDAPNFAFTRTPMGEMQKLENTLARAVDSFAKPAGPDTSELLSKLIVLMSDLNGTMKSVADAKFASTEVPEFKLTLDGDAFGKAVAEEIKYGNKI